MKRTAVGFAILGLVLSGCNEEAQETAEAQGGSGDIQFAYPTQGQQSAPTSAPVFLRFGGDVTSSEDELADALLLKETTGEGKDIAFDEVTLLDDGRGLRAEPETDLTPGRSYELSVSGVNVGEELVNETIEFSTAASDIGPVVERTDLTGDDSEFSVARILPYADQAAPTVGEGTDEFPVSDLSTFRLQFNEPVNENTLSYGANDDDTVRLTDSDGDLVPAEMLARDHRLTIDPDENLDPDETYELSLSGEIKSRIGDASLETPDSPWSFTPVATESDSGERSIMAQKATTDAGKLALTGEQYNGVRLSATTLGGASENETVQTGTVFAELGYIPKFDQQGKSVPLTIDRGTLMEGSSVEVKVGGEVPSGFGSETIDVRFLSDANGYLMPNPYTDDPDAPRLVRLFLDLGMNTGEPRANGALAQELLHVELVGTAMVEDGTLTMEAISIIEPNVLGVDKASGLISFRLEEDPNAPEPSAFEDSEAPTLKSWAPGEDHQDKLQPQDPVSLFFNEPLLPSSVNEDTVTLRNDDGQVPADLRQNGGNVIVDPAEPLEYGKDYKVILDGDVLQDLAGNKLGSLDETPSFSLPETEPGTPADVGPAVLTARPGYPCAKADMELDDKKNGRCLGGITEETKDSENFPTDDPEEERERDEFLPIEEHGTDSPIIVRFSQNMDKDSITEDTFIVEKKVDGSWETVDVSLEKSKREVRAVPLESWEEGSTYRYRLIAGDQDDPGIASEAGVPLYTELLNQYPLKPTEAEKDLDKRMEKLVQGGPEMVNRFTAVEGDDDVLTPLSNLPTADANSNFTLDDSEITHIPERQIERASELEDDEIPADAAAMEMADIESDVLSDDGGAIGCEVGTTDCDSHKKMIFKTANLDVEVGSEPVTWDDGTTGMPVKLDPSVLFTSSSDVWIQLSDEFLAQLATDDGNKDQRIPTGPMVMRMRYQKEDPEAKDSPRNDKISGLIYRDESKPQGERLRFKTKLDAYLDAPFLLSQLEGNISETNLEDDMRSFEINGLTLDGPIRFFDDGRMQIVQKNTKALDLPVDLRGNVEVQPSGESCEDTYSTDFFIDACEAVRGTGSELAEEILDVDTDMTLRIPRKALYLNYISPYTQKQE